uniref:EF-hand domain-containing protein n=1 Tax=Salix viminalis TaxID=40686 RepID=A0A6N2NFN9_SALVM
MKSHSVSSSPSPSGKSSPLGRLRHGDGKISPAELRSCITTIGGQLSIEEAGAAVSFSDMDGDGLLGFQDFQCLMAGSASEEEKTEELRQAFGMYETEPGSGCITPASLKRMLSRLGESRSINDCKAMIRTFDLNGDGVLSFHEFAVNDVLAQSLPAFVTIRLYIHSIHLFSFNNGC